VGPAGRLSAAHPFYQGGYDIGLIFLPEENNQMISDIKL
jgi:hypothetical protein